MQFLFTAGFAHKTSAQSIDLNCVRLAFQVFLEGNEKGAFTFALKPVVSDPIYDRSKSTLFNKVRTVLPCLEIIFAKLSETDWSNSLSMQTGEEAWPDIY